MDRLDDIGYNLNAETFNTDEQILIARTVLAIPSEFRKNLLDKITFINVGSRYGFYYQLYTSRLSSPEESFHIIILNLSGIVDTEHKQYFIAHGIASFHLEQAADKLCKDWGFKNPSHKGKR